MSRSEDIDLADQTFPSDLRLGMLRLQNADTLPLSSAFIDISGSEMSLTLRGNAPPPWDGVSHVSIRMFKFPAGRTEFQRQVEFFGGKRKARARLPDRVPFNPAQLALPSPPDGWTHEAYPRAGYDFIHIYQSPKRAVLIRWLAKQGTILDHPLLQQVRENLSFDPGEWVTKFPSLVPRKLAARSLSDSRLPADVATEVQEAVARARERLKLGGVRSAKKTIDAIQQSLEALRKRRRVEPPEKRQLAIDLGACGVKRSAPRPAGGGGV